LVLLAAGVALAFGSWPALIIVVSGIVPIFAWRAHAEEALLSQTFGESYALYRKQIGMITPAAGGKARRTENPLRKSMQPRLGVSCRLSIYWP
jgi:hypothetical protein